MGLSFVYLLGSCPVFSGDRLNDLSFEIGDRLIVLVEHQSTINKNMPLRLLLYIAELYAKMIGDKRFNKKLIPLDWPEFIVVYNGEDPWHEEEDEFTLRLSDAFRKKQGLEEFGITNKSHPLLELEVKVYNINKGHNEKILRQSESLNGYSTVIAKVREFEKDIAADRDVNDLSATERRRAIARAVDWCIENHILEGWMTAHRQEVINMLYEEWSLAKVIKAERAEEREVGRQEGKQEGIQEGEIKGERNKAAEIARNARSALAEGISPEIVQRITGMDMQTIQSLAA
jgi:hypothetical protein